MPVASVTAIGLVVAAIALVATQRRPLMALVLGLSGAWAGFLAGAFIGVIVDVVAESGVFVFIVGHTVAALGAVVATTRFRSRAWPRRRSSEAPGTTIT